MEFYIVSVNYVDLKCKFIDFVSVEGVSVFLLRFVISIDYIIYKVLWVIDIIV